LDCLFVRFLKFKELGLVDDWKKKNWNESYDSYIRNGLMTQLVRLELGADIEESHMRNHNGLVLGHLKKERKIM
jgi:dipeptidyl-peptidase-3